MTGIYDCFGYGEEYDVPFPERYRLIRAAGFDCVMLWWSDRFGRGEGYRQDVRYALDAGLVVENLHAPVHQQHDLSRAPCRAGRFTPSTGDVWRTARPRAFPRWWCICPPTSIPSSPWAWSG